MTSRILTVTNRRGPYTAVDDLGARVLLSYVASIVPNSPETMAQWPAERLVQALACAGWPGITARRSETPSILRALSLFEGDITDKPCTSKNLAPVAHCTEPTATKYLRMLESEGLVRKCEKARPSPTFAIDKLALATLYARSKAPYLASAADSIPCPPARELRAASGLTRSQWQATHNQLREAGTISQTNTSHGWALEVLLPRRLEHEALRVAGRAQSGGDTWASAL